MTEDRPTEHGIVLTEAEKRKRRLRSLVIGWSLAALVVVFFLVTLVRLGEQCRQQAALGGCDD